VGHSPRIDSSWPSEPCTCAVQHRRDRALPNRVPRALAAGCQDVDAELLANGMSVATNSTPDSMGVATKPGL
jgi:hypothetical protein